MTLEVNWKPVWSIVLAAIGGVVWLFPPVPLWGARASEFEVKAAFLYNFGRFVEWPPEAPSSKVADFPICVLGHDPFGLSLDSTINGEKIDGKDVVARRISSPTEAASCRVVYVSSSEDTEIKEILPELSKFSVLTVSDIPDFVENGGMVQFVLTDRKVRFKINLAATRQARLNMSSQLLKVAEEVRGGSPSGTEKLWCVFATFPSPENSRG